MASSVSFQRWFQYSLSQEWRKTTTSTTRLWSDSATKFSWFIKFTRYDYPYRYKAILH